jgi:hypothetical protein
MKTGNYNEINGIIRRNCGRHLPRNVLLSHQMIRDRLMLMFHSETWTANQKVDERLEAVQIKFLRSLTRVT